jgi:hypothetical protein
MPNSFLTFIRARLRRLPIHKPQELRKNIFKNKLEEKQLNPVIATSVYDIICV